MRTHCALSAIIAACITTLSLGAMPADMVGTWLSDVKSVVNSDPLLQYKLHEVGCRQFTTISATPFSVTWHQDERMFDITAKLYNYNPARLEAPVPPHLWAEAFRGQDNGPHRVPHRAPHRAYRKSLYKYIIGKSVNYQPFSKDLLTGR